MAGAPTGMWPAVKRPEMDATPNGWRKMRNLRIPVWGVLPPARRNGTDFTLPLRSSIRSLEEIATRAAPGSMRKAVLYCLRAEGWWARVGSYLPVDGYIRSVASSRKPNGEGWKMNRDIIEQEYRRLGYSAGWRFITCPVRNIHTAKTVIITLQPAGSTQHGPDWSQEDGSAYIHESWDGQPVGSDMLQHQFQEMCKLLAVDPESVLSGHFIPFRSPTWEATPKQQDAIRLGRQLWSWVFGRAKFERIICIGKKIVGGEVADLLGVSHKREIPVGWGSCTATTGQTKDGAQFVALPHLSRFKLFGRPASEAPLRAIFGIWDPSSP
jgi:hypothetical protein